MSSTATSMTRGDDSPTEAFTSALNAAVGSAAVVLEKKVVGWADRLSDIASGGDPRRGLKTLADRGLGELADSGGAKQKASAEWIKATLHGKNPMWPAVKGAWEAGTPVVRAAIIAGFAAAILLLPLSPVPLLVFLLSLLILAAVQRVRTVKR
jgi:hypothetical protein